MTAAPSTHKATLENGPSIIDRRLIWTSATGITTADTQSYGGCLRKWFYDQVEERKAPPTKAMLGGTELHTEIENHLRKGDRLFSPLALAGRSFIPHPGPNLFIERPIHFTTKVGVDIYGHVDLYNNRGEHIDASGDLVRDPPWSFEVKDWKTTSDFQYTKSERELAENIQLTTYAEAGFRLWPDLEHAWLTHVYFRTKGRPESKLVTVYRNREQIAGRWEYAEGVVRLMADAAREPTAETVPANVKACDAYRGCPHCKICSAYGKTSLDNLYSKIADDFTKDQTVGILANNPNLMQPQPDMRTQLANEEAQMRAQQQQLQAPPNQTQAIAAACARIMSHGRGFPTIAGNASVPYSMTLGLNQPVAPGYVFTGQGGLAGITLSEVAHFEQLAKELDDQRAQQPTQVAAQQLVQAPPAPVQNFTQQVQQAYVQATQQPQLVGVAQSVPGSTMSLLPPNAPVSQPQLAAEAPKPAVDPNAPPAEEPKKGRGRPKKSQDATPEGAAAAQPTTSPSPGATVMSAPPATAPSTPAEAYSDAGIPLCVLVNARSDSFPTKSLAGYVDYINRELAKRYCVDNQGKPTLQDVRCAPKESPLAFGGWKGAVREVVKNDPPTPAAYHLDTFMDDLNEAVADALRIVADDRSWLYIRGVR